MFNLAARQMLQLIDEKTGIEDTQCKSVKMLKKIKIKQVKLNNLAVPIRQTEQKGEEFSYS